MADKKISQLTGASTPLAGTEVLPIVQSGSTVKVSAADITAGRNISANSITLSGGTANGVSYLNASKVVTTGTALVFDGTNFGVNVTLGAGQGRVQANGAGQSWFKFYDSSAGWNFGTFYKANGTTALAYIGGGGGSAIAGGTADDFVVRAEGDLLFAAGGGTERAKVTSTGNISIANGNLAIGTAAKGIDFSANSHAAGMTSELLNWYEEGTWTPTIAFGGASTGITYSKQLGRYTRIGRNVTVWFDVRITSKGSVTGDATIEGLPFTVNADCVSSGIVDPITAMVGLVAGGAIISSPASGGAFIYLFQQTTTARGLMNDTQFNTTASLGGSLTYFV